ARPEPVGGGYRTQKARRTTSGGFRQPGQAAALSLALGQPVLRDDEAELKQWGEVPGAILSLAEPGLAAKPVPGGSDQTALVAILGTLLVRPGRIAAGPLASQALVAGGVVYPTSQFPAAVQQTRLAG